MRFNIKQMCLAPDVGSELPVTGGMQADPSQRIAMAPGISDGGGSGDFQAPPSFGCLIMGSTLARIPSRGIALSRLARSPFPLRLPGSQHHTGFWLLKPAGYCQAPHRPQASRALPARLPPPGPVLCRRLLSWVAGATLDLCRTPSPPAFRPLRALDTAAAPASCLGGASGVETY